MIDRPPKFENGEFVVCFYDFLDFFSYIYDEDDNRTDVRYYGIVVASDDQYQAFVDEYIYSILCLDGEIRYFMESEIELAAFR
ncbi:hypothetical protein CMI37_33930 [Candidatus Pacearchaeota archaeon]|nr:hypothetical protein [Candidatus Pacearchaeota archaeon]